MSGYAYMLGPCIACTKVFAFNPHKVPSLRVNGTKEPVCRTCHELINAKRRALGLPPHPEPLEGAYGPLPAEEL